MEDDKMYETRLEKMCDKLKKDGIKRSEANYLIKQVQRELDPRYK